MKSTNMKDTNNVALPESFRRTFSLCLMWGGWTYAAFIFTWGILEYNPSQGHFAPQWVSFSFTASLVLAIAGTLVRSRMRLQDTVIAAFQIGMAAATAAHNEIDRRVSEIEENGHS